VLWVYSDAGGECLMMGCHFCREVLKRERGNRFLSFWVDYLPNLTNLRKSWIGRYYFC
jgi:hypothetical protein